MAETGSIKVKGIMIGEHTKMLCVKYVILESKPISKTFLAELLANILYYKDFIKLHIDII